MYLPSMLEFKVLVYTQNIIIGVSVRNILIQKWLLRPVWHWLLIYTNLQISLHRSIHHQFHFHVWNHLYSRWEAEQNSIHRVSWPQWINESADHNPSILTKRNHLGNVQGRNVPLTHKTWNDPMKRGAFEMENFSRPSNSLFSCTERPKILQPK